MPTSNPKSQIDVSSNATLHSLEVAGGGLPTPDERPTADVVIFDAKCNLCTKQIKKLLRWDSGGRFCYLSLHDPVVYERYSDLTHEALMEQMVVIDQKGNRHWGPYAVRYFTSRLPKLWWAAPFAYFPGSMLVWRPLYSLVARNRYRFNKDACDSGTCRLHR